LETDEYFRVISHYDGIVEGYLGRTNDEDLFFGNHRRGLAYFNDYQDRKDVYFTFDGIELYRLNSILPGSPMRFVLKKINLATMEEYNSGNNYNLSVTGQNNVVTAGSNNQVEVSLLQWKGDVGKLKAALADKHVPTEDIEEITAIVQQEKPNENGILPTKAESWINRMIKKALDGGWDITAHTAGHLLAGFIKSYYGLPG